MNGRDTILARVRAALADRPADEPITWQHGRPTPLDGDLVDVFCERVADYGATVERCTPDEIPARIAAALDARAITSVVLPPGLDPTWRPAIEVREEPLTAADLDATGAVVTACAVGIATTGTIVLDHGPDQGRRALTLVPDLHVCVIRENQIVTDVPEAVARLHGAVATRRPLTWVSGGSATSDIELTRVEGVHGPRTLHVIVTG